MPSRYTFSREQTVVVALLIAFSVMSYFDRTIMSIAGPQIMQEFALSATQMGSVYSAFTLSYAVMMIPAGRVTDRLGCDRPAGTKAHASGDGVVSRAVHRIDGA